MLSQSLGLQIKTEHTLVEIRSVSSLLTSQTLLFITVDKVRGKGNSYIDRSDGVVRLKSEVRGGETSDTP